MDDDLKPGDRVKLGGRGPDLTVESVAASGGVPLIHVVWLDQDDRICRAALPRECLVKQEGGGR